MPSGRLFVEHITNIDCSILDARRGIVGQSWQADITLSGEMDACSMVMDFSRVKKQIIACLDTWIDHCLVIPENSPSLSVTHRSEGRLALQWRFGDDNLMEYSAPPSSVCFVPSETISKPSIAAWLQKRLKDALPASIHDIHITLHDEAIEGASYCYSHGLKKHDGNCQRIVHGHRSRIVICNAAGARMPEAEAWLAEKWRDIYIATREDIQEQQNGQWLMAYRASQGAFSLSYPVTRTHVMDADSTVESIAVHITGLLAQNGIAPPGERITVRAYEGIRKGAIETFTAE